MKKFKLTGETIVYRGRVLHRIKALKDFADVKKGDLGGWVESKRNLSQKGTCWLYDNAVVYGNAKVYGNAVICGDAEVYGYARVYGDAVVCWFARVYGQARVFGNAEVRGHARVFGRSIVFGDVQVFGHSRVFGSTRLGENTEVSYEVIASKTGHYI